jgi:hypothetical protein
VAIIQKMIAQIWLHNKYECRKNKILLYSSLDIAKYQNIFVIWNFFNSKIWQI